MNINFNDFQKMELRVAKILTAERVEGSEKLIRLEVACPELVEEIASLTDSTNTPARRQIVAGIGKAYEPESLVGKEIVIVANLEPRKLMGLESQGMLLAAHDADGLPVLLVPEKPVPEGARIS